MMKKGFYDRTALLKRIRMMLDDGQDLIIEAPLHSGKTSLIKQALFEYAGPTLYLDLYCISHLDTIVEQIVDFIHEQDDTFALFHKNKQKDVCMMLIKALSVANEVATAHNERLVIAMDEVQDISQFECGSLDIFEVLRGTIQHHKFVTYVFIGSKEPLMSKIFKDRKSPFYRFGRIIKL